MHGTALFRAAPAAGKTTLLDVISGRKNSGHIDGSVLYGISRAPKSFLCRNTGYVEQFGGCAALWGACMVGK